MQSACQAITYAICLNELGADRVHSFQGKEPSGRAGDDIVLDHQSMETISYLLVFTIVKKFREITFACNTLWKNEKNIFIGKIYRQINYLLILC